MSEINKNLQELKNNFSAPRESSVGKKVFFIFINLENIYSFPPNFISVKTLWLKIMEKIRTIGNKLRKKL